MKRILVLCLFLFCAIGCAGCMKSEEPDRKESQGPSKTEEKSMETIGDVKNDYTKYVVLTDGNEMLTKTAEFICEKIGAVHWNVTKDKKDAIDKSIGQEGYVLIGTDKNLLEFEFSIRNCLEEELLKEKKVSLFLVDQEEKKEVFEEKFKEWYPGAVLLPVFTMNSDPEIFPEEMGRVNGWLTTVMTYDMVPE